MATASQELVNLHDSQVCGRLLDTSEGILKHSFVNAKMNGAKIVARSADDEVKEVAIGSDEARENGELIHYYRSSIHHQHGH